MALTSRDLAGDNTAGPFAISFNYLSGSTIKVQLIDTLGVQVNQSFTFTGTATEAQPSGTAVLLDAVAPSGYTVHIYKDIDMDSLVVQWGDNSELTRANLLHMSTNLMEQAQLAYDQAKLAADLVSSNALDILTLQAATNVILAQAAQAVVDAQYWADLSQAGALVANPSGVAIAARDAAIAARDAAIVARDITITNSTTSTTQAGIATTQATAALVSANAANASKIAMDATILAGSLKWNGSSKFVSVTDPDPVLGSNGDFWFKREV